MMGGIAVTSENVEGCLNNRNVGDGADGAR